MGRSKETCQINLQRNANEASFNSPEELDPPTPEKIADQENPKQTNGTNTDFDKQENKTFEHPPFP